MTSLANYNNHIQSINQCKVMIQSYYDKIYYLKSLSAEGFKNISSDEIDSSLYRIQTGISDINVNKSVLKRKLHKRKLKRLKIRRAKIKVHEDFVNGQKHLHDKIDQNLKKLAETSLIKLKKEENIDNLKWKVQQLDKKIEKSINTQSIINGLTILRTLRENQLTTLPVAPNKDAYNCLLSLENPLKIHIGDLQTAKKLLEQPVLESTANKARYTPNLCEKLFGDRHFQPNPLDRMPMGELIEARKYWDQFVVNECDPDGSHIPKHWIGESDESL